MGFITIVEAVAEMKGKWGMQLEAGKKYIQRNGRVAGPITESTSTVWPWHWNSPNGYLSWNELGQAGFDGRENPYDLVLEWTKDPQPEPQPQPQPMTKKTLLDLAIAAVADRGLNYGKPEDNFARIARRWNAHLINRGIVTPGEAAVYEGSILWGGPITPTDVAMMCADLKLARLENQPEHQDSWVDLAGYAACGAEIALTPTDVLLPSEASIDPSGDRRRE